MRASALELNQVLSRRKFVKYFTIEEKHFKGSILNC